MNSKNVLKKGSNKITGIFMLLITSFFLYMYYSKNQNTNIFIIGIFVFFICVSLWMLFSNTKREMFIQQNILHWFANSSAYKNSDSREVNIPIDQIEKLLVIRDKRDKQRRHRAPEVFIVTKLSKKIEVPKDFGFGSVSIPKYEYLLSALQDIHSEITIEEIVHE